MASIAATRQALADAVSTATGLTIQDYPFAQPKTLDGWVVVNRLSPAGFRSNNTVFGVAVILGTDLPSAERHVDTYAPLLMAATNELLASNIALEVQDIPVSAGVATAPLYALVLTLTMEVD